MTNTSASKRYKKRPFFLDILIRLLKEKPLAVIGGVIVLTLFIVGIFAHQLAPFGMDDFNLAMRLKPPGEGSVLGTDNLGRDIFSRIIYGAQISMFVSLGVAALSTALCTIIGGVSGFLGGKLDMIIQRLVDAVMCFPPLIIMMTVIALIGTGLGQVILVLGVLGGIGGRTRVVRSAVLSAKQNLYIEASRSIGLSEMGILARHILPNIMAPIIILFTLEMGNAILAEATLSFLGFGVPPPAPSWGGMLNLGGRQYMLQAPWIALWPGLALALVVYGINMLGDGLRDVLDPRLRGGIGSYTKSKKLIARRAKIIQTELSVKKGE